MNGVVTEEVGVHLGIACRDLRDVVYIDIETAQWFDLEDKRSKPTDLQFRMGWGYRPYGNTWTFYDDREEMRAAIDGKYIVGFNHIHFDLPILYGGETIPPASKVFDLFADIRHVTGRWVGLNALSQLNGVGKKLGDGEWASKAWRDDWESVRLYCQEDVRLLFNLVRLWAATGRLLLPEGKRQDGRGTLSLRLHDESRADLRRIV